MKTVKHSRVKREAHQLARQSTDQSWNPFRHVDWGNKKARRDTWNGPDVEAQDEVPVDETDSAKLNHARSAPDTSRPRDFSISDTMGEGSGLVKETNGPASRTRSPSQQESGETIIDSQRSTMPLVGRDSTGAGNEKSKVRNRRPDAQPTNSTNGTGEKDKKFEKKQSGLIRHVHPKEPFTPRNQLQRTFLNSWINILLIAAPVGIAINYVPSIPRIAVFVINFIAIVPLAAMLSFATEEIALRTGETLGGLLNATFG